MSKFKKQTKKGTLLRILLPAVLVAAAGVGAGIALSRYLKPPVTNYLVDEVEIDLPGAKKAYEQIRDSGGDYSKLRADYAVQMAYQLFYQEEQNSTMGVGYSLASIVKQEIQTRTVKDGNRYFEESNSVGIVNLFDRMFMQGDTTDTYWGSSSDYGSHPKVSYSNDEYKEKMGRYISIGLAYVVAPETIIEDNTKSGDPPNGITKTDEGYRIEIELDPKKAVVNYQKQMQAISNLKYKPDFEYCHITVDTDRNLNLIRMKSHEKYMAVTASDIGSKAEGVLITEYYHNALPEFGFPEPGSKLPDYPASLES